VGLHNTCFVDCHPQSSSCCEVAGTALVAVSTLCQCGDSGMQMLSYDIMSGDGAEVMRSVLGYDRAT